MDLLGRPFAFLGLCYAGLAVFFTALWLRQRKTRNATSVDAGWSGAIGLIALTAAAVGPGSAAQRLLAGTIAAAWSLRLTWHLVRDRILAHAAEDGRYLAMRRHFGDRQDRGFFWFYQAQAGAALVFAAPFVLQAHASLATVTTVQSAGLAVAIAAQILVAIADKQLAAHRRDPAQRGRTCRTGLWRYSRHPNYFFEWMTWCGFGLVHVPVLGWVAAIAPLLMWLTIRFVSGVPFSERQALASRGDDYRRYAAETNVFMPWPPRRLPAIPTPEVR